MPLPPCFSPTPECRAILERVRAGYDLSHDVAAPLVKAGLLRIFTGPTARSGYELTNDGVEALKRW